MFEAVIYYSDLDPEVMSNVVASYTTWMKAHIQEVKCIRFTLFAFANELTIHLCEFNDPENLVKTINCIYKPKFAHYYNMKSMETDLPVSFVEHFDQAAS